MASDPNSIAGFSLATLVVLLWAVSDLLSKKAIDKIGSKDSLFYTQGISAAIYFALVPLFWGKGPFSFSASFWLLSIASGAANAFAWVFYFKALSGGKLSIAQPITYLWPFVTIALSVPFFGERAGFGFVAGAFLAGLSVYLIAFSGSSKGKIGPDAKWGLFAMLFWGFSMFLTKPIVSEGGSFYPVLITRIVFFAIFLPYYYLFSASGGRKGRRAFPEIGKAGIPLALLVLIGIFNSASFLLYNFSVELSGASLPALVSSISPAVVLALSFFFLKERISKIQALGIALAVLGLVAVSAF